MAVDEEGGTSVGDSKMRFAAPVLASLALVGSVHRHFEHDSDTDPGGEVRQGGRGGGSLGGFFGLGLLGAGLAHVARPISLGLAALGVVRTVYGSVVGKGRDVSFPADTPIQVRLAPGPSPTSTPRPVPSSSPSP